MDTLIILDNIPIKEKKTQQVMNINNKIYTIVPDKYENNKSWPELCNWDCYNCTCEIVTRPYFVSNVVIDDIHYRGNNPLFCTDRCTAAEIVKIQDPEERNLKFEYLKNLHYKFTGKKPKCIFPAKDKSCIINYGGYMTKAEYRENLKNNI